MCIKKSAFKKSSEFVIRMLQAIYILRHLHPHGKENKASGELANKPDAVIASTSGDKAHASLLLTLSALSAKVSEECTLLISFVRSKIDSQGNVKDMETIKAINRLMDTFINDIKTS